MVWQVDLSTSAAEDLIRDGFGYIVNVQQFA
jgi:hypothetical protein